MGGRLRVKVVGWFFFCFGLVWFCVEMVVLVVEEAGLWYECDMPSVPGEMCFRRMDGGIKRGREGRSYARKKKK